MKTTSLRWTLAACLTAAIAGGGALAISGASASENEAVESGACEAKAVVDGGKPAALPEDRIRGKLAEAGYTQVRSLGREDGCVEAKGLDKDGKRFEVYVHPATGEIVGRR